MSIVADGPLILLLLIPSVTYRQREEATFTNSATEIEPTHEIMALFVLRKLILQTCMRGHPVGLDVWFLVEPFVYFHTLCVRTANALARLRGCAGSSQPSLVAYVISTIISCAGSINDSSARESATEETLSFGLVRFLFYRPSTHFRSFRARSVNLATLFLSKLPRQFTST